MPVFSYSARDLRGQSLAGTLIADSPAQGRARLRDQGLRIERFDAAKLRPRLTWLPRRPSRRRQEQVAETARLLALLLRAGVPLEEALEVLTREQFGALSAVVKDIRDHVTGGEALADGVAQHPSWFDSLFVSAVRVGELSGNLDEALTELAEYLRAKEALRHRVTAALAYPLILTVLGTGVVIFLMTYVIPQLLQVLVAAGRPLPTSTLLLKKLSDLLVGYWWLAIGLVVGCIAGAGSLWRVANVRRAVERGAYRLPVIGPLLRKAAVAEFAQRMALLLRTGIPFVEAVRSVEQLTRNLTLGGELRAIASAVEAGSDIAPTLRASRVFPPVVVHLVAVGQDSGELTAMLCELRLRYDTEVKLAVERFTGVLEPLLIVVLASAVGFVVFACLMPILEATKAVG